MCLGSYEHILWIPTGNAALRLHKVPFFFFLQGEWGGEGPTQQLLLTNLSGHVFILQQGFAQLNRDHGNILTSNDFQEWTCIYSKTSVCYPGAVSLYYECPVSSLTDNVFCSSPSHHHVAHTMYKSRSGHADQTCFDQLPVTISCCVTWRGGSEKELTHTQSPCSNRELFLWIQSYIGDLKHPTLKCSLPALNASHFSDQWDICSLGWTGIRWCSFVSTQGLVYWTRLGFLFITQLIAQSQTGCDTVPYSSGKLGFVQWSCKTFSAPHTARHWVDRECTRNWEGTQPGQLTPGDQRRSVQYSIARFVYCIIFRGLREQSCGA